MRTSQYQLTFITEWQLAITSKTASSPPWSRKLSLKFPPTLLTVPDVSENNSSVYISKGNKIAVKEIKKKKKIL